MEIYQEIENTSYKNNKQKAQERAGETDGDKHMILVF